MTVTTIDTSAAERRALRIGIRLDAIADNYEQVVPMIAEALELRDHETLGYRSPGDYLADRFGKALARMPMAIRRETVAAIDAVQPLSTRSLAPVFEVDNKTIHNDRRAIAAGVESSTPESAPSPDEPEIDLAHVDKTTGEIHETPQGAGDGTGKVPAAEEVEAVDSTPTRPPAPRPAVTGMDGKTYARPEPAKPRRRPITDAAGDAGWNLRKAIERLERITEDDRFSRNKEEVAAHLRGHLLYAVEVCQDLLDHHLHEGA